MNVVNFIILIYRNLFLVNDLSSVDLLVDEVNGDSLIQVVE